VKSLPLYTDRTVAVDRCAPLDIDTDCTRCKFHEHARGVCIGAEAVGEFESFEGALLIVDSAPTAEEDAAERPMSSSPNRTVRSMIEAKHDGPIVYAHAMRCPTRGKLVTEKAVDACRPYTAGLVREVKPSRIFCLGRIAFEMVLGVSADPMSVRRGYGYTADGVPVFMFPQAYRMTSNRFLAARLKRDIEWALDETPERPPHDAVFYLVETPEQSAQACEHLRAGGWFAYDTETSGLMGDKFFQVVCLAAVRSDEDDAYLWTEDALKDADVLAPLQALLRDPAIGKVGHNLKFDLEAVAHGLGLRDASGVIQARGVHGDTMLWRRALDTDAMVRLEYADNLVGMGGHKTENKAALDGAVQRIRKARKDPRQLMLHGMDHPALRAAVAHPTAHELAFGFALVPREILYRYCALDTVATARLSRLLEPVVNDHAPTRLVSDTFLKPATAALAQVEAWGMSADRDAAFAFGEVLKHRRTETIEKIRALGCECDLNSSDQLGKFLFGELDLPVIKVSEKTNKPSTDKHVLAALKDKHPVIEHLLTHAQLDKLISTYADGLIPHIRDDGRIRTSLNLAGTRSGRLSSSNPNLQNIPSGGEYAKTAKAIFNAPPGHVLIQLDYSQLEIRIAAMLSGEPKLIEAYRNGVDLHMQTARLIAPLAWKIPPTACNREHRRAAKAVVFGLLYGKSAGGLAKDLKCSRAEAQRIVDAVLGSYDQLAAWIDKRHAETERNGIAWTQVATDDGRLERARHRQLHGIADTDDAQRNRCRNAAVNTPVQGSASDFMLRTICAVVDWIVGDGIPARVTNTVHDSIILEAPCAWALDVALTTKSIMEQWPACGVPLVADVDIGPSWGSMLGLTGLRLVGQSMRAGMTDDEIIHVASADDDTVDEMGDDVKAWLTRAKDIAARCAL
jgi:DNA polymerase I-like protein with 3'-5' exonuclease and polymerase domains/uracil-DNA glycosylase